MLEMSEYFIISFPCMRSAGIRHAISTILLSTPRQTSFIGGGGGGGGGADGVPRDAR
jgi:hypothetical protein